MEWYVYPIAILGGLAAGFINTVAGNGSAITLPLLIWLGLPPSVANGTNRVGVLFQTTVGTVQFHRKGVMDWRSGITLAIPAVVGSLLGAQIAVEINEALFERIIGVVMLIMLVIIIARPERWLQGSPDMTVHRPGIKEVVIFFLIGIYGGFIQIGVGIFLLAALVLGAGFNLTRANPIKGLIVLFFTVSSLVIFLINGQVNWQLGLIVAVGQVVGAWLGANFAVNQGAVWVRRILIVVVSLAALRFLGILPF
ncbi:MAG: sulfite exporter TauE/SafE family protein [Caldilineales bacterium]